jgi:hypothetical protein
MTEVVRKRGRLAILGKEAEVRIVCPIWWFAANGVCGMWSYDSGRHGCDKEPGHSGDCRCPCGKRKKRKVEVRPKYHWLGVPPHEEDLV